MKVNWLLMILLLFSSCSILFEDNPDSDSYANIDNLLNPDETFTEDDAPVSLTYDDMSFSSPWGYDKDDNASREYPILVSGCWGEGEDEYADFEETYPAFLLSYQYYGETAGQTLAQWIAGAVEEGYRIDTNRIYLTGFSAGGSGSFTLAKGMYLEDMYFAAIIRLSGQSQSDLTNEIATETAVWYHIGLDDTDTRIEVAEETLEYMRNYECNSDAVETEEDDTVTGYARTTITLTRSGFDMFKYSEYTGVGHWTNPMYDDEEQFPWMFGHSLLYR
jgi:hypothetical protein